MLQTESSRSSEELIRDFGRSGSEEAFRVIVDRHLPLVYGTALRVLNGDTHLAEDVAQTVFTDLARRAARFSSDTIIAGWLYQHAWFTASKAVRGERRRQVREQQSIAMNEPHFQEEDACDPRLREMLDEALTTLKPDDRDAIVLRFFQRADLNCVGQTFGISADAAQKRIARALEKLRGILSTRGVTVSAAGLTAILSSEIGGAPAALAQSVTAGSLAALSGAGAAGLPIWLAGTKAKAALTTVLLAGLSAPFVWQFQKLSNLRGENESLREQLGGVEELRAENQRFQTGSLARAERSNSELLELQRLRGEITLLRRQYQEATNARALTAKGDSAGTEEPPPKAQVLIETKVAEMTHETFTSVRANRFPPVSNPMDFTLVLDRAEAEGMLKLLTDATGVDIMSAPKVATVEGRQARISVTDDLALPDGRTLPLGLIVDALPQTWGDGTGVNLDLKVSVTEFLGWENQDQTIPRFRTRGANQQAQLQAGQMLVMGRGVFRAEGETAEPNLQIYCFSAPVIDAAGNIIRPAKDLQTTAR